MQKENLSFDQLMGIYNHIAEEERHFNELELEYRKLASQWLLVSLGAVGFVLSKQELVQINAWVLVMGICVAASIGILILWMLDLKVYHELLHAAFRERVLLERQYKTILPQIGSNMVNSQTGGDIISKVILFYFFSVLLLIVIANIALWMYSPATMLVNLLANGFSAGLLFWVLQKMRVRSYRLFDIEEKQDKI